MAKEHEDPTLNFSKLIGGNDLFHRALFAIGLNGSASTVILTETLSAIGASPTSVTIDELGVMLPEVERRLLLLVPHELAHRGIARLRNLILGWEG